MTRRMLTARELRYFRAIPCWCGERICEARATQPEYQARITRHTRRRRNKAAHEATHP